MGILNFRVLVTPVACYVNQKPAIGMGMNFSGVWNLYFKFFFFMFFILFFCQKITKLKKKISKKKSKKSKNFTKKMKNGHFIGIGVLFFIFWVFISENLDFLKK